MTPFFVVEQHLLGKHPDQSRCEDGIVVSPRVVAVIDGVTPKGSALFEGVSGGVFAKNVLSQLVQELPLAPDALAAVKQLSLGLRQATERAAGAPFDSLPTYERPAASLIIFLPHTQQIVMVGDCQALLDGMAFVNPKKVDTVLQEVRALVLKGCLARGATVEGLRAKDPGRDAILPLLRAASLFSNTADPEFGYAVLDGSDVQPAWVRARSTQYIQSLVLASDGYPKALPSLKASEDALLSALAADPLCIGALRGTKPVAPGAHSFDDRAYIRLKLR